MVISESLNSLTNSVREMDLYQQYKHILKQVEDNEDIRMLVSDIKRTQKELVNAEYKGLDISSLESSLEDKKRELYAIPLYQDYINISDDLKNLMSIIETRIQAYLNDLDI